MSFFSNVRAPSVRKSEQASADIPTPAAGEQREFIDSTTHHQSRKDAAAVVRDLEVEQAVTTSVPSATGADAVIWFDDGGSPANLLVYWRRGGVLKGPFPVAQDI